MNDSPIVHPLFAARKSWGEQGGRMGEQWVNKPIRKPRELGIKNVWKNRNSSLKTLCCDLIP
ncbi:hypothetical protein ACSBL2_05585 [Pedobacter sp. AW31-3R]|uniref:hypothetical protein n=1 Tax=Pedobacter sp. AW31-3R TaxID=3445781 RepID=UPI003F9FA008